MTAITISTLDDPVAIVHIPIALAKRYASELFWSVANAPQLSNEFFNVTSNQIEIAVFAHVDLINQQWAQIEDDRLQISSTWRVFEISSGDGGDSNNYDSPHLRHVSAPLSKAGISILYQSSYFSDYLLVKESNFQRSSEIFAEQGWNFETTLPTSRRRSQLLSPITPISRTSRSPPEMTPLVPVITVLPHPLACVGFPPTIEITTADRIRQLVVWPEQARQSWKRRRSSGLPSPTAATSGFYGEEEVLDRPFISYTRTIEGASIVTETRILRWMFGRKMAGLSGGVETDEDGGGYESTQEGTEYQLGGQLAAGYVTDTTDLEDSDEDDEAESDGLGITPAMSCRDLSGSTLLDHSVTGLHTPPADDDKRSKHLSLPTTPRDSPDTPMNIPISWLNNPPARRSSASLKSAGSDRRRSWERKSRSRESGSRTDTDDEEQTKPDKVGRKRCLQLDLRGLHDEDDIPMGGSESTPNDAPRADQARSPFPNGEERGEGLGHYTPASSAGDTAQVYHMDKSGLVTTFSDLLNSRSIRMLYSSTFHTANVLVEARDVHRARRLLQGRGRSPVGSTGGRY